MSPNKPQDVGSQLSGYITLTYFYWTETAGPCQICLTHKQKFAATLHHLFNIFTLRFFSLTLYLFWKVLNLPSSSNNLQCNISASDALSRLSFLEILSDTQQIFEEVNVQRGINLLADGTCHHDRTGNATDRKKTQLVRRDTENKPNIAIIWWIPKVAPSLRGKYQSIKNDNLQTVK